VDDPDGTRIWEQLYDIKLQESFQFIEPDIIMVRVPPSDQILDVLLRGASVACQVSVREGFEVKVNMMSLLDSI
jgi:alpha,alpha-trehalose phosphorylase (configuration-retaining)